jgi:hypothetical protein
MGSSRDERDRGNRVMSIALVALVIALASLMWNVVSTAYSWKLNKPAIDIFAGPEFEGERDFFAVDVRNTGGSPVGIKEVYVHYTYEGWWKRRWLPRRKGWLMWVGTGQGIGVTLEDCTIQPYHNQKWEFDKYELLRKRERFPNPPKQFLVQVRLATGKSVYAKALFEVLPGESQWILDRHNTDKPQLPSKDDSLPD